MFLIDPDLEHKTAFLTMCSQCVHSELQGNNVLCIENIEEHSCIDMFYINEGICPNMKEAIVYKPLD